MIWHPDAESRTLQRFRPEQHYANGPNVGLKRGMFVDVETTGLDTATARIIQFAFVPFYFDSDGIISCIGVGEQWYADPDMPIPPEVTALTGITDEMVAGKSLPTDASMAAYLDGVTLIVAHNAEFDRPIMERYFDVATMPWACSYREVPWPAFGCACSKLPHILMEACGEFAAAHTALIDCHVGLRVLSTAEHEGRTAFSFLLDSARQPTVRVFASGAPFDLKDRLKARGYRWNAKAKVWFFDATPETSEQEVQWLNEQGGVRPSTEKFGPRDRYSVRVNA